MKSDTFIGIFIFYAIFGGAVVAFLFWGVPFLWGIIKPWLHMVTA